MKKIRVGIIGGAGYTGGELIRILLNHPQAEIGYIHSRSKEGKKISTIHADLEGDTDATFSGGAPLQDVDVVFLCLGHGESKKFLEENTFESGIKIIDLSQDFRMINIAGERSFVYGLPELNKEKIVTAKNIANPGCFATAICLGLLPMAAQDKLQQVFTTGITGSTGAGQSPSETSHFSWRANNIQAYKSLQHQHLHEIGQSIQQLQKNNEAQINFVPWRGDFTRGIFCSSQMNINEELPVIKKWFTDFYAGQPFVHVSDDAISLKQVVNTNKVLIQIEKQGDQLVVHSTLDNLLKGASGQAVQNMNLMFGLEETMGLKLKANYF
ncbi:MAG: N-acetyl-gamma-glutamyl-phosphate reductase [Ferruginibacter sp.]